jgi:hypothetical protein
VVVSALLTAFLAMRQARSAAIQAQVDPKDVEA